MQVFWSAAARGFFLAPMQPVDAIEITMEQHRALLAGQAAGQEVVADEDGTPMLRAPVATPLMADAAREIRDRMLASSDWTQIADSPLSPEVRATWAIYRQALRDVPEQSGFPTAINWPSAPA